MTTDEELHINVTFSEIKNINTRVSTVEYGFYLSRARSPCSPGRYNAGQTTGALR
jgi:hypothetical protein